MGGDDLPTNKTWLCPTAHVNVHELLRLLVAGKGVVAWDELRRFSLFTRALARKGYDLFVGLTQLEE